MRQALDKTVLGAGLGWFIEVIAAAIVIGLAGRQNMGGGDDDLVGEVSARVFE
jgi:hypothetical protein